MLPPTDGEWLAVYLRRHRHHAASVRTVRALYRALSQARSPTTRELADEAQVDQRSASRVIARLRELGVIRTHGGEPIAGGGRARRIFESQWPPEGRA